MYSNILFCYCGMLKFDVLCLTYRLMLRIIDFFCCICGNIDVSSWYKWNVLGMWWIEIVLYSWVISNYLIVPTIATKPHGIVKRAIIWRSLPEPESQNNPSVLGTCELFRSSSMKCFRRINKAVETLQLENHPWRKTAPFCSPVVKSLGLSQIEAGSVTEPIYIPAMQSSEGDTKHFFRATDTFSTAWATAPTFLLSSADEPPWRWRVRERQRCKKPRPRTKRLNKNGLTTISPQTRESNEGETAERMNRQR